MKGTDITKVAIVSAVCLIGLVVVLKNVLNIPADILSRDIILWIIIYSGFTIVLISQEETPRKEGAPRKTSDSPWLWSAVIIGVTLAIIAVYAFG
jgi:membrane protease YdiL (CAAX protease family)